MKATDIRVLKLFEYSPIPEDKELQFDIVNIKDVEYWRSKTNPARVYRKWDKTNTLVKIEVNSVLFHAQPLESVYFWVKWCFHKVKYDRQPESYLKADIDAMADVKRYSFGVRRTQKMLKSLIKTLHTAIDRPFNEARINYLNYELSKLQLPKHKQGDNLHEMPSAVTGIKGRSKAKANADKKAKPKAKRTPAKKKGTGGTVKKRKTSKV